MPAPKKIGKAPPKLPPKKKFEVKEYDDEQGSITMVYGNAGDGKSTLAMLARNPVFIGLDDGARMLRHPVTGKRPKHITGIDSFQDLLDVLESDTLNDFDTIILDTVTESQKLAEPFVLENYPHEKGHKVKSLEGYGYGKGYKHLYDVMLRLLVRLEALKNKKKDVIVISQMTVTTKANPTGDDYLYETPALKVSKNWNIFELFKEKMDHVVKIDTVDSIAAIDGKAEESADMTRAIFVRRGPHYYAKNRSLVPVDVEYIPFESPADDTFWKVFYKELTYEGDK